MRKHRRFKQDADLDITAFMNLMIVLVPILLINLIFAQTAVLELNFPTGEALAQLEEDELELNVVIRPGGIEVTRGADIQIAAIANTNGEFDFSGLSKVMREIKQRLPEKQEITLRPEPDIEYQTIVSAMDTVRSYDAVVAGSVVEAELFPNIAIAAAPVVVDASGSAQ